MTQDKGKRKTQAKGFTIERTFTAMPEKMWALWTTKEGVESWWGPEGFTTTVHQLDPRRDGVFDYSMTAVGPEQVAALKGMGMPLTSRARNVYTEVAPPRRLAMRTRLDFIPDVAPYEITMEVEFRPARGGTKVVFTSSKMHSQEWQRLAYQGQMSQFEKLAKMLERSSPAAPARHPVTLSLPSDREVLITRIFDASPERVFRAHADPKALEAWWGPRDYTTEVVAWDLRKGGAWRIVQRTREGVEHAFRGVFQEIVPSKRLTQTFEYEGTPGHVLTQTLTFEGQRGGKTKLTVRAVYASREDRDGMLSAGMEWGMRQSYDRLDELLGN